MDSRAAVARAAGEPLEVDTVQLEGASRRRGDGGNQGHRRLPHRRIHLVRLRPGGPVPGHPRSRGGRGRRRSGQGCRGPLRGRSRHPAVHAGVPAVQVLHLGQDQSLRCHPCDPGPGPDAGRHIPLLTKRRDDPALHGHVDLLQLHRCCPTSRWPRSARTPRSTRSATSAVA